MTRRDIFMVPEDWKLTPKTELPVELRTKLHRYSNHRYFASARSADALEAALVSRDAFLLTRPVDVEF